MYEMYLCAVVSEGTIMDIYCSWSYKKILTFLFNALIYCLILDLVKALHLTKLVKSSSKNVKIDAYINVCISFI